ncbi:hypothetical protein BRCON_2242 [Candidatus Sumerlaea chitinivorans]|uniref:HEAT repeat domain-containing protein n=1 Tax=Sumerlaea chitinivorans TaxID=2250252 RepID=A0A2Z4Y803_SUMC1|nr:hypothetical protein BRCON_2242 [Candidatus Sumerlaea chitinivorans]
MKDPDSWVRSAAAEALAELRAPEATDALCEALNECGHTQKHSFVVALAQIGDSRAIAPLLRIYEDASQLPFARADALSALASLGAPGILDRLVAALKDAHWEIREAAARTLGKLRAHEALEPLICALDDPSYSVREAVVEALERIGGPKAAEGLCRALEDSEKGKGRVVAFGSAPRKHYHFIRWAAAAALGKLRDPIAVEPLCRALKDPDFSVRTAAATALREIGDPRALGPLGEALNDPEQGVRAAAAEAIGKIAAQASTPHPEA